MAEHAKIFMYGVGKYYQGLDLIPHDDDLKQVLQLNSLDYNHDIKFALKCASSYKQRDLSEFASSVLDSKKFQIFLNQCFSNTDG